MLPNRRLDRQLATAVEPHPSITLVAAGASGFLTLIQCGERPDRYGRSPRMLPSVIGERRVLGHSMTSSVNRPAALARSPADACGPGTRPAGHGVAAINPAARAREDGRLCVQRPPVVCFVPARHRRAGGLLGFTRSPRQRGQEVDGGTSRPSALAVLRLITGSNFVGACTGRSAGLSPLRMRSTYAAERRNWST